MGLLYLFTISWVFFFLKLCLLYHLLFRIDVGLFCRLALLQFFFLYILVQNFFFWLFFFFFFCLKVEQINCFYMRVFLIFLKG